MRQNYLNNTIMSDKPKTIGQALLATWKKEKEMDSSYSKICPFQYYVEFNHKERHVELCNRVGIEPLKLGAWLRKPITSLV